ncbi:holliday junction resolvase [Shewanella sp. phage 1/44]|uniref:holliday junction resolvase n=1 Tax=Shewanella sp. phage 1/44 TaxID=1458862 RepID=UPI0004F69E54|nr:holliday junction resolvase [Shewanella sp. phage 1/44]AHK11769.1 holliday junction resolvase [Shewanella sp. phage 1/44]
MTPEKEAEKEVLLAAPSLQCRLLRNNNGAVEVDGRFIRFGLGNISKRISDMMKSSDYIGVTKVVITQEMVGKTVGVITAIEVKPKGFNIFRLDFPTKSREFAQLNFLNFIREFGGFAGFVTSGDDLKTIINHYIKWLKS